MKPFYTLVIFSLFFKTYATQWNVGPGLTYTAPSKVSALVQDGDTVNIISGLYSGDVALWTANNLLLRGVGDSFAHLDAAGNSYDDKAIWVINGNNTTIQNIEFSGCTISQSLGNNGAGIRQQGGNLHISHCYFHDNQDGILSNADSTADILIEYTEFRHNGAGDGYSHNMYIGHIHSFTLRYCYSHLANVGHEVKTRAYINYILYNRIMDEDTGNASYEIDIPNGGQAFIIGNLIQKDTLAQNPYSVSFGEEGYVDSAKLNYASGADTLKAIYVVNNTFVNELIKHSPGFIRVANGVTTVEAINNLYLGPGTFLTSNDTTLLAANIAASATDLEDSAMFNYQLTPCSKAIDAGVLPGMVDSINLLPIAEYMDNDTFTLRGICGNSIDVGAYEYCPYTTIKTICQGDTFNNHTVAGTYFDTISVTNGCDSTVALILRIDTVPAPIIYAINNGDTLTTGAAPHYRWYREFAELPSDTNQTLITCGCAAFSVIITDSLGCMSPMASYNYEGIQQQQNVHQWSVYPNPSNGKVNIIINGSTGNNEMTIKVFNYLGQEVLSEKQVSMESDYHTQLDMENLSSGLYLVQLKIGDWTESRSFAIKH